MTLNKILEKLPNSDLINIVKEIYEERISENKQCHLEGYQTEVEILDRIISQYLFLSLSVRDSNDKDKLPGRFFYTKLFLSVIADNFYLIKQSFTLGFHIQFQNLLRTQIEYSNNLIAFIGDDEFFIKFSTSQITDKIFTPKPIHSEKSIEKLFKEEVNSKSIYAWKIYKEILISLYKDLSEVSHGNIPRISFQSLQQTSNVIEEYKSNYCGVNLPLPSTIGTLRQSLHYFQITLRLVWIHIEKKDLLDKNSPFFKFIDYYKDKFELIKSEND